MGKNYFGLFELSEMGAAKCAGLITYCCTHHGCNACYTSDRVLVSGEAVEVPEKEALAFGLAFDSKGLM